MKAIIVVDEPDDYVAWFAQQKSFAEQNPDVLASFKQKSDELVKSKNDDAAAVLTQTTKASL